MEFVTGSEYAVGDSLPIAQTLEMARAGAFARAMASRGVPAVQHYEPLHASPGARGRTRQAGSLEVTEAIAPRLLRLPLHAELESGDPERVVETLAAAVGG